MKVLIEFEIPEDPELDDPEAVEYAAWMTATYAAGYVLEGDRDAEYELLLQGTTIGKVVVS